MGIQQPRNEAVLRWLASWNRRPAPVLAAWDSVEKPYENCGTHPDVVARVWDEIGRTLPADCRCLVHGTPALTHPRSHVILAFCGGTNYELRLPGWLAGAAVRAGCRRREAFSDGRELDLRQTLGAEWFFGGFLAEELAWCRQAYEFFDYEVPEGGKPIPDSWRRLGAEWSAASGEKRLQMLAAFQNQWSRHAVWDHFAQGLDLPEGGAYTDETCVQDLALLALVGDGERQEAVEFALGEILRCAGGLEKSTVRACLAGIAGVVKGFGAADLAYYFESYPDRYWSRFKAG